MVVINYEVVRPKARRGERYGGGVPEPPESDDSRKDLRLVTGCAPDLQVPAISLLHGINGAGLLGRIQLLDAEVYAIRVAPKMHESTRDVATPKHAIGNGMARLYSKGPGSKQQAGVSERQRDTVIQDMDVVTTSPWSLSVVMRRTSKNYRLINANKSSRSINGQECRMALGRARGMNQSTGSLA
ncbi:hypothetical protein P152DRAFT_279711 [Eremomyces bilateralis CBS 781.70]|uniref:Uncharacterized protein n=1 Tax=Eremomyces bilateralis CBS 781.70 TaxID=1392243 RepID=A0A6G1G9J7_9PEZI|nr:uncharacterized protein P152DRAFT_279711 [Eremomyces bilateralis CBS 781.70]KAF1814580.1 hypothetical protein P152DRAFT_279711 [Eremomyces bilateralis CBS 781.70]